MKAIDAMVVWTPNDKMYNGNPLQGQVEVTTIPEPEHFKKHPMSIGACDHDWNETDDTGRIQLMQSHYYSIIHRSGIEPNILDVALSVVDEFRGHIFSREEPDWEESY